MDICSCCENTKYPTSLTKANNPWFLNIVQRTDTTIWTGITNEADEARDAPNYVPRVFSSATHYGSIYTDSRFVLLPLHNAHIVQYLFLATEQGGT